MLSSFTSDKQPKSPQALGSENKVGKWEVYLLLFIIALAGLFHLVLQRNAGAFWRDECSSILLAKAPSWSDLFSGLFTDSFPALWVVLLRLWNMVGSGDAWLRSLGFWLSMGAIASLWYTARTAKLLPPLLGVALVALNPSVFYWGDCLRAYALAMLLVVLLFGFVWRFCEQGGKKNIIVAGLTAILAAHSNYQSSYLILAICLAGAVVCAFAGRHWRSAMVIGIGFIAAMSMVPYRPVILQYGKSAQLISIPSVNAALLWERFSEGFGSILPLVVLPELCGLCLGLPIYFAFSGAHKKSSELFRRSLYAAITCLIAPIGCYFFAKKAGFPTQCWYYIPLLGLVAMAIEMSMSGLDQRPYVRQAKCVLATLLIVTGIPSVWKEAHIRRTTMDLAANNVSRAASVDDLVLINPFWEVVSFQYYYTGRAPWSLLPVVPDDQRGLSYQATIPLLISSHPLNPTYERIEQTLRHGGKVWIVGGLPKPRGSAPPEWICAPHPMYGWQSWAFMEIWSMQTSWFMVQHTLEHKTLPIRTIQPVSRFENVDSIAVFSGWKDKVEIPVRQSSQSQTR